MDNITLIASTTMGFETTLKFEVMDLGYKDVKVFDGKVEFQAPIEGIARSNLWLRTAGKVAIKMAEFKATTFDELFETVKSLPWENWIQVNDKFPVDKVSSRKSVLFSKSDCQRITKKGHCRKVKICPQSKFTT